MLERNNEATTNSTLTLSTSKYSRPNYFFVFVVGAKNSNEWDGLTVNRSDTSEIVIEVENTDDDHSYWHDQKQPINNF
jgi:hypothetical protein